MKRAYIDTSALVAVQFGEPERPRVLAVMRAHDELVSTTLIIAEMLATLRRASLPVTSADQLLRRIERLAAWTGGAAAVGVGLGPVLHAVGAGIGVASLRAPQSPVSA